MGAEDWVVGGMWDLYGGDPSAEGCAPGGLVTWVCAVYTCAGFARPLGGEGRNRRRGPYGEWDRIDRV